MTVPETMPVPMDVWDEVQDVRAKVAVSVEALLVGSGSAPVGGVVERIAKTMTAQDDRIRGNRSADARPTWSDCKLCILATLKDCVARLESA